MSNKEIIQENNLKLQDCVDLANNLPDAQNIEPIYSVSHIFENNTGLKRGVKSSYYTSTYPYFGYIKNYFYLTQKSNRSSSQITYFGVIDSDGAVNIIRQSSGSLKYLLIDVDENYIYYMRLVESYQNNIEIYRISLTTGNDEKYWTIAIPGTYVGTNSSLISPSKIIVSGLYLELDMKNMSVITMYNIGDVAITVFTDLYGYNTSSKSLIEFSKSASYSLGLDNVQFINRYGTKIIANNILYEINSNKSLGIKIKDNVIGEDMPNFKPTEQGYIKWFAGDYYYVQSNINSTTPGYLVKFDEENNVFNVEKNLDYLCYSYNYIALQASYMDKSNNVCYLDYDEDKNVIIGYTFNNNNFWLNSSTYTNSKYVLEDYEVYDENRQSIIGTMPNNGELNYTSSTEEQTIPEGYTSGGTIAPAPLTDTEYEECLTLSQQILGEISL